MSQTPIDPLTITTNLVEPTIANRSGVRISKIYRTGPELQQAENEQNPVYMDLNRISPNSSGKISPVVSLKVGLYVHAIH